MNQVVIEIVVILVLLLANGVFAMTEIAIVTARKSAAPSVGQKGAMPGPGSRSAWPSRPTGFSRRCRSGSRWSASWPGAFGGATIAEEIAKALSEVPALARYSEAIGLGVVVVAISYFSLVLGELVPKRIGLGNPEGISLRMARPMQILSVVAGPVVRFLSVSTDSLLRLLPTRPQTEAGITEEEVKGLMQEGLRAGAFQKVESDIVASVLGLDQLAVREIMTPRAKVIWLNRDDPHETVWHKIVVSGHSFFPVYEENRDRVVGVVSVKAIYANLAAGAGVHLKDLIVPPLMVPATQNVLQLVETFKKSGKHLALVADEFGGIAGSGHAQRRHGGHRG